MGLDHIVSDSRERVELTAQGGLAPYLSITDVYTIHCKALWIQASAKC